LPKPNPAAEAPKAEESAAAENGKAAEAKPKYDFQQRAAGDGGRDPRRPGPRRRQDTGPWYAPTEPGARYWLQAASFRDSKQAEELKAKLALIGLRAQLAEGHHQPDRLVPRAGRSLRQPR
jgi:cell division protein FtsN